MPSTECGDAFACVLDAPAALVDVAVPFAVPFPYGAVADGDATDGTAWEACGAAKHPFSPVRPDAHTALTARCPHLERPRLRVHLRRVRSVHKVDHIACTPRQPAARRRPARPHAPGCTLSVTFVTVNVLLERSMFSAI